MSGQIDSFTYWSAIVGADNAVSVSAAVGAAYRLDSADIDKAIDEIGRAEAVGPILEPSLWVDGTRSRNAREMRRLLRSLRDFVAVVREVVSDG